jgi:hypothetical protein
MGRIQNDCMYEKRAQKNALFARVPKFSTSYPPETTNPGLQNAFPDVIV